MCKASEHRRRVLFFEKAVDRIAKLFVIVSVTSTNGHVRNRFFVFERLSSQCKRVLGEMKAAVLQFFVSEMANGLQGDMEMLVLWSAT